MQPAGDFFALLPGDSAAEREAPEKFYWKSC
jgi:hypothetical protein